MFDLDYSSIQEKYENQFKPENLKAIYKVLCSCCQMVAAKEREISLKPIIKKYNKVINSPLYAAIILFKSQSFQKMKLCYDLVMNFSCYAEYMDLYLECKKTDQKLLELATSFRNKILQSLDKENGVVFNLKLQEFIDQIVDRVIKINQDFYRGENISEKEILFFTKAKSCDAKIYTLLSDFIYPLEQDIQDEIYKQQLFRDLKDDFADIEEDIKQKEASPLLIRFSQNIGGIEKTKKLSHESIRKHPAFLDAYNKQISVLLELEKSFIPLSRNHLWIKDCQFI